MRIAFFASGSFALPCFNFLRHKNLVGLYTRKPEPRGRGLKDRGGCPIYEAGMRAGLEGIMHMPDRLDETQAKKFEVLAPDIAVLVDYGLKIPKLFLTIPRLSFVNLHPSLLPAHRGASPIVHALLSGASETGISLIRLTEKMDAGPVFFQEKAVINPEDTALSLLPKLAEQAASMLEHFLALCEKGQMPEAREQKEEGASQAPRLKKADGLINWHEPAEKIITRLRAFTPFPSLYFQHKGVQINLVSAIKIACNGAEKNAAEKNVVEKPGTIINARKTLDVKCGQDVLRIERLRRAGKAEMDVNDFLNGFQLKVGDVLAGKEQFS